MFVYTVGDIIGGVFVILAVGIILFKIGRYQYLKFKFRKCPKCGSETLHHTRTEHFIGEINTYELYVCQNEDCRWKEKVYF